MLRNILRKIIMRNIFLIAPELSRGHMNSLQETVGSNIRQRRQALGLSQQVLAERANISRRMITLIESGTGNASLGTLDRLADALQLTFAGLMATGGNG